MRNAGACQWSGYTLVFDSGELMGATSPQTIGAVAPGQEVDLSVNFTAPSTSGTYRSYWRIRNSSGVLICGSKPLSESRCLIVGFDAYPVSSCSAV